MKKILMAVFAVAAAVSAAGAQQGGVNFDGGGAAVPMPKLERVQAAAEAQAALSGALMPRRTIVLGKADNKSLAKLLREAAKGTRASEHCYPGGVEVVGEMVCMLKCCDVDTDDDDQIDTSYCEPEYDSCRPIEPEDKAALKSKAAQFAGMAKGLKNKKTRGPYEDCINYCIDEWQSCTGDNCGDQYQRCINVCDDVVNKP